MIARLRRIVIALIILLALYRLVFLIFMPPWEWYHTKILGKSGVVPSFISHEGVDDSLLRGVETGPENSENLIVYIHGSPGSSSAFHNYLSDSRLLDQATLISIDRPGFGLSQPQKGLSLQQQGDIILDRLQLREEEHIILVGHSLGGPLVASLAARAPKIVDGIVILAGSFDPSLEPNYRYAKLLIRPSLRRILPPVQKHAFQELVRHKEDLITLTELLPAIESSVSIVHGEVDTLVPIGNVEYLEKHLSVDPDIYRIAEENHFIVWSQHELVVSLLTNLLEQHP